LTGDDRGAEASFRRAIALQPSSFAGYNQLGAFYADLGRFRDAAGTFKKLTELVPDSYRAFSNLGGVSTLACDFPAALAAYLRASDLKPDDPNVASNLGMTQLWTGRTSEAVTSLEMASREAPNDFVIWGNLADAYRAARAPKQKSEECLERSISLARSALELNPSDAVAHSFIATCLAKMGHGSEAAEAMRKALALDEKNPSLLADAAVVAALGGRDSEAMEFLRKAVSAGYCPAVIAKQPEFARFANELRFRSIVASPSSTAG
jgi:Flp pilus assembly protein TadD